MDLRKSGTSSINQCAINASPLLGRYVSATQKHKYQKLEMKINTQLHNIFSNRSHRLKFTGAKVDTLLVRNGGKWK